MSNEIDLAILLNIVLSKPAISGSIDTIVVFLDQTIGEAVAAKTEADNNQANDISRSKRTVLGHERQGEGDVTKGNHQRQCQIEKIRGTILENKDDQQVIELVENKVDVHEFRSLRVALVRSAAIVVTGDGRHTDVAFHAVPHILG